MLSNDPSPAYLIMSGFGICFVAVTVALLMSGADRSSALGLGLIAAILGGVWSWFWTTRA